MPHTIVSAGIEKEGERSSEISRGQLIIIKCDEFNTTSNMDRGFCCGCMCPIREGFLGELELVYSRWVAGKI